MTPKIDSPEESGLDDDRFDDNKQTVPIVDIGTEEGDSMSLSNSKSVAKSSTSKSLGYAEKNSMSEDVDSEDESLTKIMRVDVGTSEGKKLVVTEEDKRCIPFSKGYRRPKKEDLVYESVQEIHPSIQRTFNNIAIASNNKIKKKAKRKPSTFSFGENMQDFKRSSLVSGVNRTKPNKRKEINA